MKNDIQKKTIDIIIEKIKKITDKEKKLKGIEICQILVNIKDINKSRAIICDNENEMYEVLLENSIIEHISDWIFNTDDYIFKPLQNGYEIGLMSEGMHCGIWDDIETIGLDFLEYKLGVQKYLKYCKDNNINKDYMDKLQKRNVPDVMKYYDMTKDFVDIKDEKVEIPKKVYEIQYDLEFIRFELCYAFIKEILYNSKMNKNFLNYNFSKYLADKYCKQQYKDIIDKSYEDFANWIRDNKDIIKSEYLYFYGIETKRIIEVTNRRNIPIALVERFMSDGRKEYIIAFNYDVEDEKLNWAYGYYYNENLKKAKEDFEKVAAGGNLSDTFKNKE